MPRRRATETDICNCSHERQHHHPSEVAYRLVGGGGIYCRNCSCNKFNWPPEPTWKVEVIHHPGAKYQWWTALVNAKDTTKREFVGKFPTKEIGESKARTLALNMERLDRASGNR